MRRILAARLFALALASTLPSAASAQQPTASPDVFVDIVEVKVVNVDVIVTDASGRRVEGLQREDFELYEDGKKVAIVNFEEISDGTPSLLSPPAHERSAEETPPAPQGARPNAASRQRLSIVIYIDNLNLRPFNRNRIVKQLTSFLDKHLAPGDRVMVVAHEQGLQIRLPFTESADSVKEQLVRTTRLSAQGPMIDSLARQTLLRIQQLGCTSEAREEARSYARQMYDSARMTLLSLETVVRSLGGLEGPKALFYVSDGIALRPGEEVYAFLGQICSENNNYFEVEDISSRLRHLTSLANASRVTFYTLEAAGVRGFSSVSAEAPAPLMTPTLDFIQTANLQDSLFNMASETGGRAVLNGHKIDGDLDQIAGDLRSYYSLGFSPDRKSDGRTHALRVEVKGKRLRTQHRTSYHDSGFQDRMVSQVHSALLYGDSEKTLDADLKLPSQNLEQPASGIFKVPLTVLLPLSQLTLVARGANQEGKVTLWIGSRDEKGRSAPVSQTPPCRIQEPMQSAVASCPLTLLMRKGKQTIAFVIHDDFGGETWVVRKAVKVDKDGVRLLPLHSEPPSRTAPSHGMSH